MRSTEQYAAILKESAKFLKDWSKFKLDDLYQLPLLGGGDPCPPYHDIVLREILVDSRESISDKQSSDLIREGAQYPAYVRPYIVMTEISGATPCAFSNEIESALSIFDGMAWNNLFMRWQLQAILKVLKKKTLTLSMLANAQKKMGSLVWPNGNMLPAIDASLEIWNKQLLSDGYPALLTSFCWPFYDSMQTPKVFSLREGSVETDWFSTHEN